jgi:hypothetical protein
MGVYKTQFMCVQEISCKKLSPGFLEKTRNEEKVAFPIILLLSLYSLAMQHFCRAVA